MFGLRTAIATIAQKVKSILASITLPVFLLWLVFGVVITRTAWLVDDAYITLRTVDNFIHGYGLTWNVVERVQSYTHPLWMFLLIGAYLFTGESFYSAIGLSISVSLATFFVAARFAKHHNLATLSVLGVLFLSNSFVDYSTSGLENPLSHLLLGIFLLIFAQTQDTLEKRSIFALALLAGLATWNRMDTLLLYIPPLTWVLWKNRSVSTLRLYFLGFLPFILWEVFSVIYYGFPFPNTAYAKLGNSIPRSDVFEMGYLYFINSLHWDPITLTIISIAAGWGILRGSFRQKVVVIGLLLYLSYILWIGGDFMTGRFFSVVLMGAVALLLWMLPGSEEQENLKFALPALIIFLAFMAGKPAFIVSRETVDSFNTIVDERQYYIVEAGLMYDKRDTMAPYHNWAVHGLSVKAKNKSTEIFGSVGMMPYFAGPGVYFIDPLALTDPLLARLPLSPGENYRPGHFYRAIPEGYRESVVGENQVAHPTLALYYDKLRLVTRGPIWSWERFVTIFELNTGKYDYLLEQYARDVIFSNEK